MFKVSLLLCIYYYLSKMTEKIDQNHISQPLCVETDDNLHLEKECYYEDAKHNFIPNKSNENLDSLGPLPAKWEKAFTESGEVYFIE